MLQLLYSPHMNRITIDLQDLLLPVQACGCVCVKTNAESYRYFLVDLCEREQYTSCSRTSLAYITDFI